MHWVCKGRAAGMWWACKWACKWACNRCAMGVQGACGCSGGARVQRGGCTGPCVCTRGASGLWSTRVQTPRGHVEGRTRVCTGWVCTRLRVQAPQGVLSTMCVCKVQVCTAPHVQSPQGRAQHHVRACTLQICTAPTHAPCRFVHAPCSAAALLHATCSPDACTMHICTVPMHAQRGFAQRQCMHCAVLQP